MKKQWISALVLAVVLAVLAGLFIAAHPAQTPAPEAEEYMEYENAVVEQILSDSTEADPVSEDHFRGSQSLIVRVKTGRYAGQQMLAENTVGPIYGTPMAVGDGVTVGLSTYADGTVRCYIYEYDRFPGLLMVVAAFLLVTVLVGGKVGLKSLVSLGLTVAALLFVLLPLLLRGWPTIPTTFLIAVLVTAATFVILGGVERKTVCACLGTLAGIALATAFGLTAQWLLRIDGYRQEYAEALLQLRQTGESGIGISGLVTAGVIVSALGAVMDVAMSISSAVQELTRVNPELTAKELLKSGMNIGRDMVGTMTNTLILAILGSGLTLIVYIYSLGLQPWQLLSSAYMSLEAISAVASSIGVMLAVPLTAAVCAVSFGKR
ncbi:MAG: YibE/F family protein [Oscillospiraceae bacterium]|nr:YibE/F family protein [Oscillospiraceae bacterium]